MANYSRSDYDKVKQKRKQATVLRKFQTDPLYRVRILIRTVLGDLPLMRALRLISAAKPRAKVLQWPQLRTKRIDHYQTSRKINSPKSNPELTKGESISRTVYSPVEELTGRDLTREQCDELAVLKIWNPYVTEAPLDFAFRYIAHVEALLQDWEACGRNVPAFVALHAPDPKPKAPKKNKTPKGGDAHYMASSLDLPMGWDLI